MSRHWTPQTRFAGSATHDDVSVRKTCVSAVNVLDASLVIQLLLDGRERLAPIREALQGYGQRFAAPHLLDAEVGQVIRRYVLSGQLNVRQGREALRTLAVMPLEYFAHGQLLPRAFDFIQHVTIYDALYVALADGLGSRLLTLDAKLAGAPGIPSCVELLPRSDRAH